MKQVLSLLVVVALLCSFARASYATKAKDNTGDGRSIIGGKDASISSYPFAVLMTIKGLGAQWTCSASVIGEFYALTAAHCLVHGDNPPQTYQVTFLGGTSNRGSNGTIFNASYYIIHDEYNECEMDNDVAVVRVTTSFFTNPAIKAITLQDDEHAASTSCYAVGWGLLTIPPNFIDANTLQIANYTLQTSQNCRSLWGERITEQMYCADYESGKVYRGDSGGPLVCGDRLHGISSFGAGYKCSSRAYDLPDVFTKVPSDSIRRFIHLHTGI
ncbi:chymotrypsin-1-like isoform X1 [Anopheles darlingi]|uniref:chymotrypsin-1-like isoform X1 n=1 Tax=Anopheles darlingi TaxID=43151 RepID=UPI0021002418|nr:chymotrypsin-1-like isoform X1 [Anopheles darlingi]